jgi:hypothetical protein
MTFDELHELVQSYGFTKATPEEAEQEAGAGEAQVALLVKGGVQGGMWGVAWL